MVADIESPQLLAELAEREVLLFVTDIEESILSSYHLVAVDLLHCMNSLKGHNQALKKIDEHQKYCVVMAVVNKAHKQGLHYTAP